MLKIWPVKIDQASNQMALTLCMLGNFSFFFVVCRYFPTLLFQHIISGKMYANSERSHETKRMHIRE